MADQISCPFSAITRETFFCGYTHDGHGCVKLSSLGGFENNMVRLLPNQHGRLAVCFILLRGSLRLFVSQLMIDMPTQNHVRLDAR